MQPTIYLGEIKIASYTLLALVGILATLVYITVRTLIAGGSLKDRYFYLVYVAGCALPGAAMLFQLTIIKDQVSLLPYLFTDITYFNANCRAGIVYYGGLIGAFIGAWLYSLILQKDTRSFLMQSIPAIPLFHMFGRIGCCLAGCCYGYEVESGGIYNAIVGHYCFPVQLYEAIGNGILFLILLAEQFLLTGKRSRIYFLPMGTYLTLYGIMRFILEFYRGDLIRGIWGGLSTSQWISILLVPIGLYCLFCPTRLNFFNHVYDRRPVVK